MSSADSALEGDAFVRLAKPIILIGVDPGVKTGIAIWHCEERRLLVVGTMSLLLAFKMVLAWHADHRVRLRIEDARQRKWFGAKGREALQGAGSIKRDCGLWAEFCEAHGVAHEFVAPSRGSTKWDADKFKRLTGWQGRTSEHGRDAALLVLGS